METHTKWDFMAYGLRRAKIQIQNLIQYQGNGLAGKISSLLKAIIYLDTGPSSNGFGSISVWNSRSVNSYTQNVGLSSSVSLRPGDVCFSSEPSTTLPPSCTKSLRISSQNLSTLEAGWAGGMGLKLVALNVQTSSHTSLNEALVLDPARDMVTIHEKSLLPACQILCYIFARSTPSLGALRVSKSSIPADQSL